MDIFDYDNITQKSFVKLDIFLTEILRLYSGV